MAAGLTAEVDMGFLKELFEEEGLQQLPAQQLVETVVRAMKSRAADVIRSGRLIEGMLLRTFAETLAEQLALVLHQRNQLLSVLRARGRKLHGTAKAREQMEQQLFEEVG